MNDRLFKSMHPIIHPTIDIVHDALKSELPTKGLGAIFFSDGNVEGTDNVSIVHGPELGFEVCCAIFRLDLIFRKVNREPVSEWQERGR